MDASEIVNSLAAHAGSAVTLGVNFLLQSTLLISLGLLAARWVRRLGAAHESVLLRAVLVGVLLCPLGAGLLKMTGVPTFSLALPGPVNSVVDGEGPGVAVGSAAPLVDTGIAPLRVEPPMEPLAGEGVALAAGTAEAVEPDEVPAPALAVSADLNGWGWAYLALAGVWVAVAGVLVLRLGVFHVRLVRACRAGWTTGEPVQGICRELAGGLGVRPPPVLLSERIAVPCLIGAVRPAILLPVAGLPGPAALRHVLLHELVHLLRRDCAWNLLGHAAGAVFFFQPLLRVLRRRIERASDDVCDDHVLAASHDRRGYAGCLLAIAERLQPPGPELVLATPMASSRSVLGRRVERILDGSRRLSVRSGRKALVVISGLMICLVSTVSLLGVSVDDEKIVQEADDGQGLRSSLEGDASPAWYLLSQLNAPALLYGLPERLTQVLVPSRRAETMWAGVDGGGRLQLQIDASSEIEGEVFIGLFPHPQFWQGEPNQIRSFPGIGRQILERLPPGRYYIGAMIGTAPEPLALGVHEKWPQPVEIAAGQTVEARVLLSPQFIRTPFNHSRLRKGFAGQWDKMDPSQTAIVRTLDPAGNPAPFCRVTFVTWRGQKVHRFFEVGTDHQGYAYCDKFDDPFMVEADRFTIIPGSFTQLSQTKRTEKVYRIADRPEVVIQFDPLPSGSGKITGRVVDQHGRPVQEYHLNLVSPPHQPPANDQREWGERSWCHVQSSVIDADGRYEIGGLAAGTYQVFIVPFDVAAYVSDFGMGRFTIPPEQNAVATLNLEVKAKELLFAKIMYRDGAPVHPGGVAVWFKYDVRFPGEAAGYPTAADGTLRIALSREERESLQSSSGLIQVYCRPSRHRSQTLGDVHVDKLSHDPEEPALLIFDRLSERDIERDDKVEVRISSSQPAAAISDNNAESVMLVYDVSDLLRFPKQEPPKDTIDQAVTRLRAVDKRSDEDPAKAAKDRDRLSTAIVEFSQTAREGDRPSSDALKTLITSAIEPDSWESAGGAGVIRDWNDRLIIRQTRDVQDKVSSLMDALRSITVQENRSKQ